MRKTLLAIFLVLPAFDLTAQSTERPKPPGTTRFEEPPPPPDMGEANPALEPKVTLRREGDRTIEEYRVNGKLYMQKITPAHGKPYVLMDHKGDGSFTRMDNTLDQGIRVPQWVLFEF